MKRFLLALSLLMVGLSFSSLAQSAQFDFTVQTYGGGVDGGSSRYGRFILKSDGIQTTLNRASGFIHSLGPDNYSVNITGLNDSYAQSAIMSAGSGPNVDVYLLGDNGYTFHISGSTAGVLGPGSTEGQSVTFDGMVTAIDSKGTLGRILAAHGYLTFVADVPTARRPPQRGRRGHTRKRHR